MYYLVYKTTNKVTGRWYIGKHKTSDLNDGYLGSGKLLHHAIEKYGKEAFTQEILFRCETEEEMNAKEAELVTEEVVKSDDNYNLCPGGQGGWGYVNGHSALRRGFEKTLTPDLKAKYASIGCHAMTRYCNDDPSFRKKVSDKISQSLKQRYAENDHQWCGRQHDDKTKAKIAAANRVSQAGERNSQFGSIWITNGEVAKKISRAEEIPSGWRRGRK